MLFSVCAINSYLKTKLHVFRDRPRLHLCDKTLLCSVPAINNYFKTKLHASCDSARLSQMSQVLQSTS